MIGVKALLKSTRPQQWYKNSLVFVGIVFAAEFLNPSKWLAALLAFAFFCMLSGGEYLINDVLDREKDRAHPVKRNRPIASGLVPLPLAVATAVVLVALALAGGFILLNPHFFAIQMTYTLLVLAYSLVLKHIVIVDVLVISAGFVMRAVAGAFAVGVPVSLWLIVCTFLLAIVLSFGKRWHELALVADEQAHVPATSGGLSAGLLREYTVAAVAALVVSYLLYAVFSGYRGMVLTTPFVVYGLFRYMYLLYSATAGAAPEEALKDRPLLSAFALWTVTAIVVIWPGGPG